MINPVPHIHSRYKFLLKSERLTYVSLLGIVPALPAPIAGDPEQVQPEAPVCSQTVIPER